MTRICHFVSRISLFALISISIIGCGDAPDSQPVANSKTAELPTASIGGVPESSVEKIAQKETPVTNKKVVHKPSTVAPKEGTPEWTLEKIADKRMEPLASEEVLKTLSAEEIAKLEAERHHSIIQLASSVIAKTHKKEGKERFFNAAVHSLMESRLQLALTGDQNEIKAVYEDAAALFKANPESKAASTGAFTLIRLTETLAKKDESNAKWLEEYVNQAKNYALQFPKDEGRAAVALIAVGRYCESRNDIKKAFECYSLITQQFPNSPFSPRASAVLRRLSLPGKKLALEGSTIDGAFVSMEDYTGKVVLITFWNSESEDFQKDVPLINAAYDKFHKLGFDVLGVNLDQNELSVDQFLEATALPGRQLFDAELSKRGFSNPIVKYYGVRNIPTYWVVDKEGKVLSINLKAEQLESGLSQILAN